jgi:hypothetical protein
MTRLLTAIAIGLMLPQLGCGGTKSDAVATPTFPVQGKVTLDGQPAEGVGLSFVPVQQTKGMGGYAVSKADGTFEALSMDGQTGIPEGDYAVAALKMTMPDGSPIPPEASAADVGAVNKLPARYGDPSQSPLVIKIQAGPNTEIALDLKSRLGPSRL